MRAIVTLSADPDQLINVVLDDKSIATFEFIYRPGIQRWAFGVSHPTLVTTQNPTGTVNGSMLCTHPNLLRPWKNVIPFGLAITSSDGGDPFSLQDFVSGRVQVFVLNAADVAVIENQFFLGAAA